MALPEQEQGPPPELVPARAPQRVLAQQQVRGLEPEPELERGQVRPPLGPP